MNSEGLIDLFHHFSLVLFGAEYKLYASIMNELQLKAFEYKLLTLHKTRNQQLKSLNVRFGQLTVAKDGDEWSRQRASVIFLQLILCKMKWPKTHLGKFSKGI